MKRVTTDCDGCSRKDIGDGAGVYVYLSRKPGEMDAGATDVDLCHRCAVYFPTKMVAVAAKNGTVPVDEDFVKFVADNRLPKEQRK